MQIISLMFAIVSVMFSMWLRGGLVNITTIYISSLVALSATWQQIHLEQEMQI